MVLELRVQQLSVRYGGTAVLREITLPPLRAGEVTAVIGPNGTGKSTLLRGIAGIRRSEGSVHLTGDSGGGSARDEIMYVPQEMPPASALTVFETVLLACQRGGPLRAPGPPGPRVTGLGLPGNRPSRWARLRASLRARRIASARSRAFFSDGFS